MMMKMNSMSTETEPVKKPSAINVVHDELRGLLSVEHDGKITWDELQALKDQYFGPETPAIEVYPPNSLVVNSLPMRHLWRLGPTDWWPDLTGQKLPGELSMKERDLLTRMEYGLYGSEHRRAKEEFERGFKERERSIRKGARRSDHRFSL